MSKVASDKSKVIKDIPLACADETAAVEFLERVRWGSEPACPRCGDSNVYKMTKRGSDERNARFLWRCRGCGKQYTVRVGTVMEESPIPLRHWCYAFWAACSSKKGVSALQIKRQTGLTYKSALFLMHRIRWAMTGSSHAPLSGDVEADETYVGGKLRKQSRSQRRPGKARRKRGMSKEARANKTIVMALVERNGDARAFVPTDVKGHNLKAVIRENVSPTATIHTDQASGYVGIGSEFDGGHHTVNHTHDEYARWEDGRLITTNSVEGFFSLLKRGVIGTFHNVSRKHLHRYVTEFEFRWNTRGVDDGERIARLIQGSEGKRLMYRNP